VLIFTYLCSDFDLMNNKKQTIFQILSLVFLIFVLASCEKKDDFITDSSYTLDFSADSIVFDTVFTTIGSASRNLIVYNNSDQPVKISSIRLEGGTGSAYRINVDEKSGWNFQEVEIAANDSIFGFMTVKIDPNNANNPLVVEDKIRFITNGNEQEISLVAWGQDAHYIVANKLLNGYLPYRIVAAEGQNVVWMADKPYVVYGYAVVDSTGSLFIGPGVKVHFHKNSGLWVYKGGSIKVNGVAENPVLFRGDRLEQSYNDLAGQWDRIWLNEGSVDNEFNYAIIENGFIGLQLETLGSSMGNMLKLNNTIIRNMSGWGIFSRFYKVEARNVVVGNCGLDAVYLSTGGSYDFRHCTFGNYWSEGVRQTPGLVISNFYIDQYAQTTYVGDLSKAYFGNCIVYGNIEEELAIEKDNSAAFNFKLENCLIRTSLQHDSLVNCIRNKDPLFKDAFLNDYRLKENSPAIGKGKPEIGQSVPWDYWGVSRLPIPDLGAYQFKP